MPSPSLVTLSLGAGVQSTTLSILAKLAWEHETPEAWADAVPLPRPVDWESLVATWELLRTVTTAIFADTGWEPAAVYAHLDKLESEVLTPAAIRLARVSNGNIRDDALNPGHRFASMPLFVLNPDGSPGMARRQCTNEYKLTPIKREVRRILGYPHPTRIPKHVQALALIGISVDEVHRAKPSGIRYLESVFPLLDLRLRRRDCTRILHVYGFGSTPKSACVGCPFHGNAQWRRMRDETPAEWADAVAFDAAIRAGSARATSLGKNLRGSMYLHASRVPLDVAPIDRVSRREHADGQLDLVDLIDDLEAGVDVDAEGFDGEQGCGPWACRDDGH